MDINIYLLIALVFTLIIIVYLVLILQRVRTQLKLIKDSLKDIKKGNLNRRILARESDMTREICYDINQITVDSQSSLIQQKNLSRLING